MELDLEAKRSILSSGLLPAAVADAAREGRCLLVG